MRNKWRNEGESIRKTVFQINTIWNECENAARARVFSLFLSLFFILFFTLPLSVLKLRKLWLDVKIVNEPPENKQHLKMRLFVTIWSVLKNNKRLPREYSIKIYPGSNKQQTQQCQNEK